jgi:hypothetical protein
MTVSARSYLVAGLVAATVGTAAVVQVDPAGRTGVDALSLRSSGFDLAAAVAPLIQPFTAAALSLADGAARPAPAAAAVVDPSAGEPSVVAAATGSAGEAIINIFNTVEPFVQYGFELTAWAAGYLPWPIGWLGQQINIAYNTGEPIVQALVYSFAYLLDGQFDLIQPTLAFGFNLAVTNFVQGEINWVLSFLPPLPPLPPPPPFPTAAVASRAAASGAAATSIAEPAPTRTEVTATESTGTTESTATTIDPVAVAVATTEAPAVVTSARARQSTVVRTVSPAAANTTVTAADTAAAANTAAAAADSPAVAPETVDAANATPSNEPRRATRSATERASSTGARSPAGVG